MFEIFIPVEDEPSINSAHFQYKFSGKTELQIMYWLLQSMLRSMHIALQTPAFSG